MLGAYEKRDSHLQTFQKAKAKPMTSIHVKIHRLLTIVQSLLTALALFAAIIFSDRVSMFHSGILASTHVLTGLLVMTMVFAAKMGKDGHVVLRASVATVILTSLVSLVFVVYYLVNVFNVVSGTCRKHALDINPPPSNGGFSAAILSPMPIPEMLAQEMCTKEGSLIVGMFVYLTFVAISNIVVIIFHSCINSKTHGQ